MLLYEGLGCLLYFSHAKCLDWHPLHCYWCSLFFVIVCLKILTKLDNLCEVLLFWNENIVLPSQVLKYYSDVVIFVLSHCVIVVILYVSCLSKIRAVFFLIHTSYTHRQCICKSISVSDWLNSLWKFIHKFFIVWVTCFKCRCS